MSEAFETKDLIIKYMSNNVVVGPVTKEQINDLFMKGIISETTLVNISSSEDWQLLINTNLLVKKTKEEKSNEKSKYKIKYIIPTVFACILMIVFTFIAFNNKNKLYDTDEIALNTSSIFLINTYDEEKNLTSTGSGFLISKEGLVVTNYHVIENAYFIEIVLDSDTVLPVEVIKTYDIKKDIAILSVENLKNVEPLKIGNSDIIEIGETVVAIGSPIGLKNTVSAGNISGIREADDIKSIQITTPISPGSSGGALFNLRNEVIGITYASLVEGQNINFAIPINYIDELMQSSLNLSIDNFKIMTSLAIGNSISNITNDGLVVEDEFGTYLCLGMGEPFGLYYYDKKTSELSRIYDGECQGDLLLSEDFVYFLGKQYNLYRLNKLDHTVEKISNNSMNDIAFYNNLIVFKDDYLVSSLKTFDIETKEIQTIANDVFKYILDNDGIYYISKDDSQSKFYGDRLYKIDINGQNNELILDIQNIRKLSKLGSRIYLLISNGYTDELFNVNINNLNTFNLVSSVDIGDFAIDKDGIYFSNKNDNGYLYKMKHDGSSLVLLDDISCWYINLTSEWVYHKMNYTSGKIDEWDLSLFRVNKFNGISEKITNNNN